MQDYKTRFFDLALAKGNLRFGSFTLKSGRISPYFFNAGGFDDGASLSRLADCYAAAIENSGIRYDMLFGPAYKGIPLAAAIAVALSSGHGRNVPYSYNRKEEKNHGEGGSLVGAPMRGSVLITDDVISAGTSVRESVGWITGAGAHPAGVAIALDRQERGSGSCSASMEIESEFGMRVICIASLDDLVAYLEQYGRPDIDIGAIRRYRQEYGSVYQDN
jgi:orotate phosphoribosyltransferase